MPTDHTTDFLRYDVFNPNEPSIGLVGVVDYALVEVRRLMFAEVMCLDVPGAIMAERRSDETAVLSSGKTAVTCRRGKRRDVGGWRSRAGSSS